MRTCCYNATIMGRGRLLEVEGVRRFSRNEKVLGFIWDADDNIFDTNRLFDQQMGRFERAVRRREPEIPEVELHAAMKRRNREAHEQMGVRPDRWNSIVDRLAEEFGSSNRQVFIANKPILMKIYQMVPNILPGVIPALKTMREAIDKHALNSHAGADWTDRKVKELKRYGLSDMFQYVHVAPVLKLRKDKWDWQQAAFGLQIAPRNAMGIGDSVIADMWPGYEAGIPAHHLIWTQSAWGHHSSNNAEPPEGTIVVDGVRGIVSRLVELSL